MLVGEIPELVLPPGDEISPSGEDETPSGREGTPSQDKGSRKDATASGIEGREGMGGSCRTPGSEGMVGIGGSCNVFGNSVVNVGSISSASTCRSRLELTREAQTYASNTPSE